MSIPIRSYTHLAVLFAGLTMAACTDARADLTEPVPAAMSVSNEKFESQCQTRIVMTGQTTMNFSSVCNMRGIGRVHGESSQTLTFTATGIGIENTTVYTTPAGDKLYASFSGTGAMNATFDSVSFTGVETYAGGTGRLSDANGTSTLTGSASLVTNTGSFTTVGSLRL